MSHKAVCDNGTIYLFLEYKSKQYYNIGTYFVLLCKVKLVCLLSLFALCCTRPQFRTETGSARNSLAYVYLSV